MGHCVARGPGAQSTLGGLLLCQLKPRDVAPDKGKVMSLVEEYRSQLPWRDWSRALSLCPIALGQEVLDIGCGVGDLSALLAVRGLRVTGIDRNPELLAVARKHAPSVHFEQQDLNQLTLSHRFDGLWCSFTAAYFVEFTTTLAQWCRFLKPVAWVCLVEIDDLLGHEPRSDATRRDVERFYQDSLEKKRYDFCAGRRLAIALEAQGFHVTASSLVDRELAFDGPAAPEILEAWRARLSRMQGLKRFFGSDTARFSDDFISTLRSPQHRALCKVVCCVGRRG